MWIFALVWHRGFKYWISQVFEWSKIVWLTKHPTFERHLNTWLKVYYMLLLGLGNTSIKHLPSHGRVSLVVEVDIKIYTQQLWASLRLMMSSKYSAPKYWASISKKVHICATEYRHFITDLYVCQLVRINEGPKYWASVSSRVHICATKYWQLIMTCTFANLSE